MILLLDCSTPICRLSLISDDNQYHKEWEAGRTLAKGLLGFIKEQLATQDKAWKDISGIVVFQGPGSFTGLRIGMTVLNTLADTLEVPIVATKGADWQTTGLSRLKLGEDDKLALPFYGNPARITKPRK